MPDAPLEPGLTADPQPIPLSRGARLRELLGLFLKLGITGFGGPAPVIGMIDDETVTRRHWLTRDEFLDMMGLTNLIPGPNSTEMAMHIGYLRAGWPGLIVSGAAFIIPAALITGVFAWAYARYGTLPQLAPFLVGVTPAVLAVILTAVWRLSGTAIRRGKGAEKRISYPLIGIGVAALAASLAGLNEIAALLGSGLLGMFLLRFLDARTARGDVGRPFAAVALGWKGFSLRAVAGLAGGVGLAAAGISLWQIGWFFLKVGAVLYGSGYVLVAFLQGGLVEQYHWLTQRQLLDAIAVGQFTPGPLLSTATFIGYLLGGPAGGVVATIAIFLPSFLYVGLLNPLIPRLRRSPWMAAFLSAVNISSVALMAAVTLKLAQSALTNWQSILIALLALAAGLRWKVSSAWLVLGGGVLGWLLSLLRF
jgi:chromate transporter